MLLLDYSLYIGKSQKDLKQVISPAKKPSKAGTPYLTDVWFPRCALDSGQHSCSAYSVGSKHVCAVCQRTVEKITSVIT